MKNKDTHARRGSPQPEQNAPDIPSPPPTPDAASQVWTSIPWQTLEQQVQHLQERIAQTSQQGDTRTLHTLQQQLLDSEAARLLAVRRATQDNEGKDTAGVDGVKSLSPKERLAMVQVIHPRHWKQQRARPVRRVWVPKPGSHEQRPLGILPMLDRCKQALVKLALEPEWEVRFEPHSYGFRPERSTQAAIRAIVQRIEHQPCYVLDADLEAAFDHVNHAALLEKLQTTPALKQAIIAWLKAGVMEGKTSLKSEEGLAQGGVLSPLLMNITLHGMETVVTGTTLASPGLEPPLLVRYGDDFVVLHPDLQELQQATDALRQWLSPLGLKLQVRKTRIVHTLIPYQGQAGFDFLGFTLRHYPVEGPLWHGFKPQAVLTRLLPGPQPAPQFTLVITPSEEASKRHLALIAQRLVKLQAAPQTQVIRELNPLIGGWAAYYRGLVSAEALSRYDQQVEQLLLNWASKRHPDEGHDWLVTRYWRKGGKQGRVFTTPEGMQLRLYRQAAQENLRHQQKGD